jgi:tetratricopeptide (TPR) repeat protein
VGRESALDAASVELSNVGPVALEQLQADVRRLAHAYVASPPQPLIAEMVMRLDHVLGLLKGHQKPAQTTDLYLIAGQLRYLIANASLDMGDFRTAADTARAAWAYGEIIDHDGLRVLARGMESMAARWEGRLDDALALARSGMTYARTGAPQARLYGLQARALGQMGDVAGTQKALALAEAALARGGHESLHDGVGGEFSFTDARLAYYAGSALVDVGAYREGADQAARAVNLYQSGPTADRSYGCEAMSLMGCAVAHAQAGELDEAGATLKPVLDLPPAHHLAIFSRGMGTVGAILARPQYRDASAALELRQSIQDFHEALPTRPVLTA